MMSETLVPAPGTEKRSMGSKIFLGKYRVSAEEMTRVEDSSDRPLKYEGEEIDSGKKVMVEAVRAAFLKREERERLEAHAIGAKKLKDVNIHALHDFGVQDDHLVYVTEDIEGTVAEEWVKTHGPMPLGPVLRIASQVVSALGAAGSQRVVHRAIIPSNLLLLPGETAKGEWPLVKLLHFEGVTSKPAGGSETASFDKSLPYTSPEQLRYGVVDSRSEIYSLGATMWFLLTGAPPPMGPDGSTGRATGHSGTGRQGSPHTGKDPAVACNNLVGKSDRAPARSACVLLAASGMHDRRRVRAHQHRRSDIERADIERTDIERTDIERTDIERTDIERTDIERTDTERTNIERTDIERTDITRTDIERTDSRPTSPALEPPPDSATERSPRRRTGVFQ